MAEQASIDDVTNDEPINEGLDQTIVQVSRSYKHESDDSKRERNRKNRINRLAYMDIQDWSHKRPGQSHEFLPKTGVAVEQLTGIFKRAMIQFGTWFSVDLGRTSRSFLTSTQIQAIINCHLESVLSTDNMETHISNVLTDAIKQGSLESLIILKIHGNKTPRRRYIVEGESLTTQEYDVWKPRIDLIRTEDYGCDPTGRGLYEFHSTDRDLSEVLERADEGIYDREVVERLRHDITRPTNTGLEQRRPQEIGHTPANPPEFRKIVRITEYWGDIVDEDGEVIHRNVFWAVGNDKFLIRRPTPNPFWHQKRPFIAVPIIRVPHSTWHKALMDGAVQLNLALNELFNLILDGGIASVWGIKQLRTNQLVDPRQVEGGISQGDTLAVKDTLPHNAKVLETVSEGDVPGESMAAFEMLSREFSASALSNELKMGSFPQRSVLATEVVELSQSQAVTLDSIVADIENQVMVPMIEMMWFNILQNMDDIGAQDIEGAIGTNNTFKLAQMTPAQRFATFSQGCGFTVSGVSAVLARVRDFQKTMALMQAVTGHPVLMQAFFMRFSPSKVLANMMKTLNINPETIERDGEDLMKLDQQLAELQKFQELGAQGQGGAQAGLQNQPGDASTPAEVNQAANPTTGLTG